MARRQRDYRAEAARRRELHPGDSAAARGHRNTPEHPLDSLRNPDRYLGYLQRRTDRAQALSETPAGARALAAANDRRQREGKAPLVLGRPPGPPAPGQRREEVESLEDAERHTSGIPPTYARIYVGFGSIAYEVDRREARQRRRAA